jgi:hypothetical protein
MRVLCVVVIATVFAALSATTAEAVSKKKRYVAKRFDPVAEYRGLRRSPSWITVRPRSYLDPGTEVFPGSMPYTDYAFPPTEYPFRTVDPTGAQRFPLPGPFDLPAYHAVSYGY